MKCFVIMPISDHPDYETGHFERVYNHIFKPAIEAAGFEPIRADDVHNTNYIAIDIIRNILQADICLCDLSSRNPNVLYELGIRQAFDLPVCLVKDKKTSRVFDIQGFRDVEYDHSLRVDGVENSIQTISRAIESTYKKKGADINSLIGLLNIKPSSFEQKIELSPEMTILMELTNEIHQKVCSLQETVVKKEVSPNENVQTVDDSIFELQKGDCIYHKQFGQGVILEIKGKDRQKEATINFENVGTKHLLLRYARLEKIEVLD